MAVLMEREREYYYYYLSILTAIIPVLLVLRMMEVVVTTEAIRHAQLQSNPNKPTPTFLRAGCPSCHPTNSVKALKGNINQMYQ